MSHGRTLILCVDRDDDLGFKAAIKGPVIGKDACIGAANSLGLIDPEDSDVNALFQAVKIYGDLKTKDEDVTVAAICGNHTDMLEGDRKIADELRQVIRETGASNCILVTDGAEDEFVLPIIQSQIPVSSVQRVIVKQIPNLEGTYYIIRKLFDDPKIARPVFLPVGIAMLLYAIAFLIGYPDYAIIVVVGVIGIYLLFKGFGIDEVFSYAFRSLRSSFSGGRFTFVAYISAIVLSLVGVIMGLMGFLEWYTIDAGLFFYGMAFVYGSVIWFAAAGLVASVGKIIDVYLNEPEGIGRVVVLPFYVAALGLIAYGASIYALSVNGSIDFPVSDAAGLRFIFITTAIGLVCALIGVYFQRIIYQWMGTRIKVPVKE